MQERARMTPFERTHVPHRSDHSDYIKICVPEEADCLPMARRAEGAEEGRESKRFTFNRHCQDSIKEEEQEEEFCRVDCDQIIELTHSSHRLKAENLRLVQESAENMQLFNGYMKEMEQRVADKNREIELHRGRLKAAEEKAERSEERARRAEFKLLSEINSRNSSRRDCGVQCEPKTYRWFNGEPERRPEGKVAQGRLVEKENQLNQREAAQLRENQRSPPQPLQKQKQMRLGKVEQDHSSAHCPYYRTLTNSPRASLSKNSQCAPPGSLKLEFGQSSSLNALISPRTSSRARPSPAFPPSRHHNFLLSNVELKMDRLISQSASAAAPLQFERGDERRGCKKGRL